MMESEKFFPIHIATIRSVKPRTAPIIGARKIKMMVFVQPERITAWIPPLASAAPRYPPRSACEELVGSQSHQVIRFQEMAPRSQANMTTGVT
jgi:hypothetical protein